MKHLATWTVAAVAAVVLASSAAHAGRYDGPGEDTMVAPSFGSVTYTDKFVSGELAVVAIKGDGDTELEVEVYDANGNFIESDRGDSCVASWTPRWTGRFTIKVINHGGSPNLFRLQTN